MKLYVGNLARTTTDDSLHGAFSQHGEVSEAVVVKDRMTGESRGFGFVTMRNQNDAKTAIEQLNGSSLDGRSIVVNEARPSTGGGGSRRPRY